MAASPQNGNSGNGNGVHAPPAAPKLPKTWDTEKVQQILDRMAEGETLRAVCRTEGMPLASTVRKWVVANVEGLAQRYAHARQLQLDAWADEMREIADDGTNDWMTVTRRDGREEEVENREVVNRSRLRVDTLKWLMSKLHPSQYGEHVTVESHHTEEIRFTVCAEAPETDTNGDSPGGSRISAVAAGAN